MKQSVTVIGFVHHEGKALLLKRSMKTSFQPGFFQLPGGKLEWGEDPAKAVEREVLEETRLTTKAERIYKLKSHIWQPPDMARNTDWVEVTSVAEANEEAIHALLPCYLMTLAGPVNTLELNDEHTEYVWAGKDEVGSFRISGEMLEILQDGFGELAR